MELEKCLSLRAVDAENLRFRQPIFSKYHFLHHHGIGSWRYQCWLFIVSILKKNPISQEAEQQYDKYRKKREF